MGPTISEMRDALKVRLDTVPTLRSHDTIPSQVSPTGTGVVLVTLESVSYDSTMGRGSHDYLFILVIVVSKVSDRAGQDRLDDLLSCPGDASIKVAIEADKTLGGIVNFARVAGTRGLGAIEYGGVPYFGAELVVEVNAMGETS